MKAEWFSDYGAFDIPLNRDGYDDMGHYYGVGEPVWCVSFMFEGNEYSEFVRADDEASAIDACKAINAKRLYSPS